jgi:hypothetical protein|tara:strand:+ start:1383 stop:1607 length:225 start_codon:yes stop_codon:yes gene_type:complete
VDSPLIKELVANLEAFYYARISSIYDDWYLYVLFPNPAACLLNEPLGQYIEKEFIVVFRGLTFFIFLLFILYKS